MLRKTLQDRMIYLSKKEGKMLLLKEMEMEIHPSLGGVLSKEERVFYSEAKEEFLQKLNYSKGGTELVSNIFSLTDELTFLYLKENQIACHQGCSQCCRQLICCTTLEMELIVKYIDFLPRLSRRNLKGKLKREAFWLNRFYQQTIIKFPDLPQRWEVFAQPLKKIYNGRNCSFLNIRNLCSIYPVRPIDCRIAKTKNICGEEKEGEGEGPKSIRLFFDQVASDLIMKEEEKKYGKLQVAPLAAWPITEQFKNFFF